MAKKRYYFDHAAATPVDPRVEKAMRPYWAHMYGNPGALHSFGQEASAAVFKARKSVADMLGCKYDELIFTGSATEANNLALRGAVKTFQQFFAGTVVLAPQRHEPTTSRSGDSPSAKPGSPELRSFRTKTAEALLPKIIVSSIEHDSILDTARDLEKEGVEVAHLPVSRKGIVDLKKLKELLDERTVLVSVMYANNEIGTIQPITEISKIVRNFRNVKGQGLNVNGTAMYPLLHTDAVQAFNYLPCNVQALGVDLLTLSSQKIYGPKGVGALYARKYQRITNQKRINEFVNSQQIRNSLMKPVITGGHQEFGLRAGTENVPGIVGFAKAMEITEKRRDSLPGQGETKRLRELQKYFISQAKKKIPKVQFNGDLKERLPNNVNVHVPGAVGQELIMKLDLAGFAVSPGAACTARVCKPSHVLKALGYSDERAENSIRITFGRQTTKAEIDALLRSMKFLLTSAN